MRRAAVTFTPRGAAAPAAPAPPPRPPCRHGLRVVEYAPCGCPAKHVYECELHDEPCTRGPSRVRNCLTCPDHEGAPAPDIPV